MQQLIVGWRDRWEFPLFRSGWRAVPCTALGTGKLHVSGECDRVRFAMETNNYKYMPWKMSRTRTNHNPFWPLKASLQDLQNSGFPKMIAKKYSTSLVRGAAFFTRPDLRYRLYASKWRYVLDACIAAIALQHGEGTNHRSNLLRLICIRKNDGNHFYHDFHTTML